MEKYNFLTAVVNACNKEDKNIGCVFGSLKSDTTFIDNALMSQILRQDITVEAQCIDVSFPKSAIDAPDNILAYYIQSNDGILRVEDYIDGCCALYLKKNTGYADITDKAVAGYIGAYISKNANPSIFISDDIYFGGIPYSAAISHAYKEKYGEDMLDKAILLFVTAKGSTRFRGRYYKLINEMVAENFIIPLNSYVKKVGATLVAGVCAQTNDNKFLVNNNLNLIGSFQFDVAVLDVREAAADYLTVKRYVSVARLLGCTATAVMSAAVIKDTDLQTCRAVVDRLLSLGIRRIILSSDDTEQEVLFAAKAEYFKNYCDTLCAALCEIKPQDTVLAVYPTYSFCGSDDTSELEKKLTNDLYKLDKNGISYLLCDENVFKAAVYDENGKDIVVANNHCTRVVLLQADNIAFATANQIQAFAEKKIRLLCTGNKPHLIDGVKSTRVAIIEKLLKCSSLKNNGIIKSHTPYCTFGFLPDNSMLYFASGLGTHEHQLLKLKCGTNVYSVDAVGRYEHNVNSIKSGTPFFNKLNLSSLAQPSVLLHITKHKNRYDSTVKYHNCQFGESFTLKREASSKNTFPLICASFRTGKGRWHTENVLSAVGKQTEIRFLFNAQSLIGTNECNILIDNTANISAVAVNRQIVQPNENIASLIKNGENEIRVISDSLPENKDICNIVALQGDFAVLSDGEDMYYENEIVTNRNFVLAPLPEKIDINDIRGSGFWFFKGAMTLSCNIMAQKNSGTVYKLSFKNLYADIAQVYVNGIFAATLGFNPYETVISDLLQNGENEITIKLYTTSAYSENEDKLIFTRFGATTNRRSQEYIQLSGVNKTFYNQNGEVFSMRDVSLNIKMGELVAITGRSGSGKTTLINLVAGLITADDGEVVVDGNDLAYFDRKQLADYLTNMVGFVSDLCLVNRNLTVRNNVLIATQNSEESLSAELILKAISLENRGDDYPSQLSSAQRVKLSIARAVAKNPAILICDNVIDSLPSADADEVLTLLYETCVMMGKTVLIVTDRCDVCKTANRVIRLENGYIVSNTVSEEPSTFKEIEQ